MLRGLYLRFGGDPDASSARRVQGVAAALLSGPPVGVTDVVPSYASIYVEFDQRRLRPEHVAQWARAVAGAPGAAAAPRVVELPARYDGADLGDVALATGLDPGEVVARHAAPDYAVFALGFTPGFPFLGPVDPSLRLPRRAMPRASVPAHSVAIAQDQTGVYPVRSPGGWHLLGHALVAVYDPHRERPFLVEPGDVVRFVPARDGAVPAEPDVLELLPAVPERPVFEVLEPGLADLVVDRGRRLAGRYGLARGGALDPWTAAQAERLSGSRPGGPLLELNLSGPVLEARRSAIVGVAGWGLEPVLNGVAAPAFARLRVAAGDRVEFRPLPYGARAYLALPGGIECTRFMGSASVDLRGRVGRPLRAGDLIGAAHDPAHPPALDPRVPTGRPAVVGRDPVVLRIERGPQATDEALDALVRDTFVVRSADRMGLRLSGHPVPGGEIRSEATPLGAIQVTVGGAPIVLLADRGTLGGYVKPAVLDPRDVARAGQLRSGQRVAFRLTGDAPYPEIEVG